MRMRLTFSVEVRSLTEQESGLPEIDQEDWSAKDVGEVLTSAVYNAPEQGHYFAADKPVTLVDAEPLP